MESSHMYLLTTYAGHLVFDDPIEASAWATKNQLYPFTIDRIDRGTIDTELPKTTMQLLAEGHSQLFEEDQL